MELMKSISERRSIRRFKPDHVSENTVLAILEAARWAPSWGNTQIWQFTIVTGDTLDQFRKANRQCRLDDVPSSPEISMPEDFPPALKKRYVGLGKAVLSSLSIGREDSEGRKRYYGDMYDCFGAPCLIVLGFDKSANVAYAMLDIGMITQTICLLAQEYGLGTCLLAASVRYPQLLRQLLPIPADTVIAIGIALGYPDLSSPVNTFIRERAPLEELIR